MPKLSEALDNESSPKNRSAKLKDSQEQRRKQQVYSRMQVLLFRHKELLKKDILKKRALLEKELQIDIQVMPITNYNKYSKLKNILHYVTLYNIVTTYPDCRIEFRANYILFLL